MKISPLISVIVPVYQVEEFLTACLYSLIHQSYSSLEIILVDDGSKDKSGEICDEFAKHDKRIKVIHKENGGLSDARNAGLDICTGEYISFIDSDDLISEYFYENMIRVVGDGDLAVCGYIDFKNSEHLEVPSIEENINSVTGIDYLVELAHLDRTDLVVAWNKLYKRNLWENLRYVKGVLHEDEFVIHHIISNCRNINLTNLKLYYYRHRSDSITASKKNVKSYLDKLNAFYDRYLFFQSHGMTSEQNILLGRILERCARPTVKNDHTVYNNVVRISSIMSQDNLSMKLKAVLLLKKLAYPIYLKLFSRN